MAKKVRPGEPLRIKAEDWNRVLESLGPPGPEGGPGDAGAALDRQSVILVRNETGGDVARFGAFLAGSPIVAPTTNEAEFLNRPTLGGSAPAGPAGTGCVLVPQVPIKNGRFGPCVVSGLTVALVAVSDAGHRYADLASGSGTLVSAASGPCRIVWKESGTGTKRCLVLVNQSAAPGRLRFKVGAATPISGATATVGGTSQAIRWTYVLNQVIFNGTTLANDFVSGGIVVAAATNQNEDGNNTTVLGPGHLISEIPTGWKYLPVGKAGASATSIDVFVEAWQEFDPATGNSNWRFSHENQLGGACP